MHKILFYNKFIKRLYMFRALCAHHQNFVHQVGWLLRLVLFPTTPRYVVFIPTTRMSEVNTKQLSFIRLFPDLSSNTRKGHRTHGSTTKQLTNLLTPWGGPSWEVYSSLTSREIPSFFMTTDGSLQFSQQPTTCPYPKPDEPSPGPAKHFFKIHFNIILTLEP